MASLSSRRLMKELSDIRTKGTPAGIALLSADTMSEWVFTIAVLGDDTVYKGEQFALRIRFGERYPIEYPEVTFLTVGGYQPPQHPHVYSNGHVCASILGPEWSPVLNCVSVCITMQSMLASCKRKEWPKGNESYVARAPANPKLTRWEYHDDVGNEQPHEWHGHAHGHGHGHGQHAHANFDDHQHPQHNTHVPTHDDDDNAGPHVHPPRSPLMRQARRLSGCLPSPTTSL